MKKSPVAGISGSIRAVCLSKADLTAAERHGKRLDATSHARAISKDPPVTTTGLDLQELYTQHVKDVFVPKCKTIAKHIIIQFPKELVDGEDPTYMLRHARAIVETIFGDESIFADRVDRDEKGRHIVDIFVAPKYIKKTKHTSQAAVSVSVHEEALAKKYERKNHPWGRGQAMQDAIFEYFRDKMKLPGVQRGDPKANPGPDWKSAEELRKEELESRKAELEEEKRKTAELQKTAQELQAQATADRDQARALREEAEATKAAAEAEKQRATAAREIAERLQQEAEALRSQQQAASQMAEQERIHRDAEIARKEAKLTAELDAATKAKGQAEADADAAAENRRASAAVMETTRSELARVQAERKQLERDRAREAAQLALLARAADDDSGFDLRPSGAGFSMARSRMTQPERAALDSPWSSAMNVIARKLAEALEQVRRALLRLADKETRLERERQEHERSVANHREAVRTHQNAVRDLNARVATLNEKERQIEERLAKASETVRAAESKERKAEAAKLLHEQWLTVITVTASAPDKIVIKENGKVAVSSQIVASLPEPVRSALGKDAPDWAKNVIKERHSLARAKGQAEAAETEWKRKSEAVSLDQGRIEKSRKVLDAIVTGKWDVTITDGFMTMRHDSDTESLNVRKIPLAEMEPSLLHAAQAFMHLSATTESVLELRDNLKKERSDLVASQPERASQIEEDQRRSDDKIRKVLRLPPGWEQGIGM